MKCHGVETTDLQAWEIAAMRDAVGLLREKSDEVWREVKREAKPMERKAWRVLTRAVVYLNDILKWTSGRQPRTFNRDMAYPVKHGPAGERLCRWDQKPVKGRRAYCSDECRIEVDIRTSAGSLRYHVKQRDKGVCANCGTDTQRLKRILRFMCPSLAALLGQDPTWANEVWFHHEMTALYGTNPWRQVNEQCKWEADHIVEVSNRGESTLENTQTLCLPCHKDKTRKMHRDRARARRGLLPAVETRRAVQDSLL